MVSGIYTILVLDCDYQVESTGSSQQAKDLTSTLRRASIIIFLVVSVMLVVVTARLALDEASKYIALSYSASLMFTTIPQRLLSVSV